MHVISNKIVIWFSILHLTVIAIKRDSSPLHLISF